MLAIQLEGREWAVNETLAFDKQTLREERGNAYLNKIKEMSETQYVASWRAR